MLKDFRVYNTLTRKKDLFEPLKPPFVGMYVCGPPVYGDIHLGNLRTFISFDVIYRYLMYLGYKVRYIRNITDVGHLENDSDDGEDKIARKAKLENIEPMEVVQRYTNGFHRELDKFNLLPPSIEPYATGHIQEQIHMIQKLVDKGFAYETEGSVYFDVKKYNKDHHYGKLSGMVLDELITSERNLSGQEQKKNQVDFALWKKAEPEHIMQWDSPWSRGFPGWHLECSVMSTKYLGPTFDIHGGGLDLQFPHHECEIAQSVGVYGKEPVKYWIHTNMLTVNGQKMSKSLGNFLLPGQIVNGDHPLLKQAFSPMTIRFFVLQAHYRSTLDFSNEALDASQKGYLKLINGLKTIKSITYQDGDNPLNQKILQQVEQLCDNCERAMNDDFNTALAIGHLFNLLKKINAIHTGNLKTEELGEQGFKRLKQVFCTFVEDVLGLLEEPPANFHYMMNILLDLYSQAKADKDYSKVDSIREQLKVQGIVLKDMKSGVDWAYEE